MINHIEFNSNCKRIAKYIMKECIEPDVIMSGKISVPISSSLIDDFNAVGEKAYTKEINRYLKNCSVKYETKGIRIGFYIEFVIEFK